MSSEESHIAATSLATLVSRFAGLLRDMLVFALLGFSVWSAAFLFAFTIPNLFRRLLGEGALSSAMIPLFTETLEHSGRDLAFDFLNRLLCRLIVAIVVSLLIAWGLLAVGAYFANDYWRRALLMTILLSPYLLLTCLAAMICGALNSLHSFALPAMATLWFNLGIIAFGLLALFKFSTSLRDCVLLLSIGILVGGCFQLLAPCLQLRNYGWRFHWRWRATPLLHRLFQLFLPALLGAATLQINTAISRILGYFTSVSGISTLYLANRILELPIGIFIVSVAAVVFPELSREASNNQQESFLKTVHRAQRSLLMITLPCTLGLILLGRPIFALLFQWGHFSLENLDEIYPVLVATAISLPFFGLNTIFVRTFHAMQDMKRPLFVAFIVITINCLGLASLLLSGYCSAVGIAFSGTVATIAQHIVLRRLLERKIGRSFRIFSWPLFAANCFALVGLGSVRMLDFVSSLKLNSLYQLLVAFCLVIPLYFVILRLLRFREISLLPSFFRIFIPRHRNK